MLYNISQARGISKKAIASAIGWNYTTFSAMLKFHTLKARLDQLESDIELHFKDSDNEI